MKLNQLTQSGRQKFERLPAFLKAGVYYTTKLEATRQQSYYPRLFAFQLTMKSANQEYHMGNVSAACRKYEEAYSCWRFFVSSNGAGSDGIDDTQSNLKDYKLTEVEWEGESLQENEWIKSHKIQSLQNIVACLLKDQNYADALPATDEILRLDPGNTTALFRRAKAISHPLNATVRDFEAAIAILQQIRHKDKRIVSEIERLSSQAKLNRQRERLT